jgi:hypothetical protein
MTTVSETAGGFEVPANRRARDNRATAGRARTEDRQ